MWGVIILIVLLVFMVYEYVFNKGSNLCKIPILGMFCKCPDGTKGDPNQKCYTCPVMNGYQTTRNGNGVDTPYACNGDCGKMYSGGFEDGLSGECWSCPSGMTRTFGTKVGDSNACSLDCNSKYPGSVSGVVPGCWKCPDAYPCRVNLNTVDSKEACGVCGEVLGTKVPAQRMGDNTAAGINNGPMTFPTTITPKVMF